MPKKNPILGISLALVMLCGSVPLGFSEPLRVQLEQGIETSQILCDNPNHVLVERTNGKLACVSEKSAERMNWEIIETNISLVEYDYPLTAKHKEVTYSQNSEPLEVPFIKTELQISNLPKLLESAEITVSVYDNLSQTTTYADDLEEWLYIRISNNFEIMSGLDDFTILHYEDLDFTGYKKLVSVQKDQVVEEFKITVVAFGVGEASITSGEWPSDSSFELVIGETETLLKDDYYKKYPKALAAKQASIEAANLAEEEALLDQGCYFVENFGMFCPPTNEELEEMRANEDDETIDSEEELRAYLKADGASDEEIEAIVREAYPKASTQSFSFLQPAYASNHSVYAIGRLTADSNQLSPPGLDYAGAIHGAKACAYEWDTVTSTLTELACRYTSDSGRYVITGLSLPSSSSDNTLDIFLTFTTDGKYAYVSTPGSNDYELSSTAYNTGFDYYFDRTSNINHNKELSMRNVETGSGAFRAF